MRKYLVIIVLSLSMVGCCPSEDTVKLSEGVAAFTAMQEADIKRLLSDEDIKAKYPALSKRLTNNAKALTRATKGLWMLLLGRDNDEVVE